MDAGPGAPAARRAADRGGEDEGGGEEVGLLSDSIAALATGPGRAALAVVRLDGRGAFEVAARVIPGFRADRPRRATLATFRDAAGRAIDRGLYTVFPAPHSYTGHDLVELACHGGLAVVGQLLAALHAAGARPAAPGEFTRRAVLNGKLDLVQAEAVGDLIDATAPRQTRAALARLEGGLSRRLAELREALVEAQALLSYEIDFPEEDDGPVPAATIRAGLEALAARLDRLLASAPAGERLRAGALVVLAGRPNAGKSSLFNALLGTDRALVTEIPGTTRDAVEAATSFDGWPVRLADTAGIWDSPDRIDRMGIEVSRRWLAAADLVLLCVESGRPLAPDEAAILTDHPALLVRTKADLHRDICDAGQNGVPVSVVTAEGLAHLRAAVVARVFEAGLSATDVEQAVAHERHRQALATARAEVADALGHIGATGDAVLASHHLRLAATALDELVGAIDVEQILDRVFGSFCVGK
ncbi:MAG TPA: tRNA uridine-5-carboxymethylaminomethyl(34) synthesis GTPase MnmE [Gemmatimonadales bacterium]|nr:tRNA uridine-5-carboxymethylaminomethyl(34) synthesis GTPase MnmE [Gemmatimonadales bacterium]